MPFHLMKNCLQYYDWGSVSAIPRLLGVENPTGRPIAELWMGAHPDGPSQVDYKGDEISLTQLLAQDPVSMLGEAAAQRFGGELPFLLKVLAADTALSIQVHPAKKDAAAGFERENLAEIELDDPQRNYRDPNHKPELLCAIEEFWGLCGFRSLEQIRSEFAEPEMKLLAADPLRDALQSSDNHAAAVPAFLEALLKRSREQAGQLIAAGLRLSQRHNAALGAKSSAALRPPETRYRWLGTLASQFPTDPGVLAPLFMQLFRLLPGQALFLQPGTLHAYLHGCGVELMANSNNVLRGGLTRKRIDLPELLWVVDAATPGPLLLDNLEPQTLRGSSGEPVGSSWRYVTATAEFSLERLLIESDESALRQRGPQPEIAFCSAGRARFSSSRGLQTISRGDSIFITATETEYTIAGPGEIYLATVGL